MRTSEFRPRLRTSETELSASGSAISGVEESSDSRKKFGPTLLAFYIFLYFSRVLDVSSLWVLHIPMMLLIVLGVTMLSRGEFGKLFSSSMVRWYAAHVAWVVLSLPFSEWRGGSMGPVTLSVQAFAAFLIIVQLVRSEADWRRVAGGLAYGVLLASLLSFVVGRSVQGRIALASGSLADPNDFALVLVLGLPFWFLKASEATGLRKALFFSSAIPIMMAFARAGSRSGLIALAVVFLVIMFFASFSQKALMGLLAVGVIVLGFIFLPDYLKIRFTTFFSAHNEENLDARTQEILNTDIASTAGREMLLKQGIRITFEHPLFGVGPGMFADIGWQQRKRETGVGGWAQVTHNTYVQFSSETGIPSFIFFVAAMTLCIKHALADFRATKSTNPDAAKPAFYMFTSLVGLAVGIFFLSVGYSSIVAVMFGLAQSLHRVYKDTPAVPEGVQLPASNPATQPRRRSSFRFLGRRSGVPARQAHD